MSEVGKEQNNWKYRQQPEHEVSTFKYLEIEVFAKTFRVEGSYDHNTQEAYFEINKVTDFTNLDKPVELPDYEASPLETLAIRKFIREYYN